MADEAHRGANTARRVADDTLDALAAAVSAYAGPGTTPVHDEMRTACRAKVLDGRSDIAELAELFNRLAATPPKPGLT